MNSPSLTPERWSRIRTLYEQALDVPPADRRAFLEREATGDEDLLHQVTSMLGTDEGTRGLSDVAAAVAWEALEASLPSPGDRIGAFEIVEEIGRGGMGVVYRARDTRLDRDAAIKLVAPGSERDAASRERLVSEAKMASSLDHPNIATVYQIGDTDGGHVYIAMAMYEGTTLDQLLGRGRLSIAASLDIASQLARGLAEAHKNGVVHRDVKPSNAVVTPDGTVKLLDFGIAQFLGEDAEGDGAGTRSYMSPEQARGEPTDARSDVWALGVVLQEMVEGSTSPEARTTTDLGPGVASSRPKRPFGLKSEVRFTIDRALSSDPADRYADAGEMLADLLRVTNRPSPSLITKRALTYGLVGAAVGVVGLFALTDRGFGLPSEGMLVLPFENLSGDSVHDPITQGIHEGLITDLGALEAFRVISPASAMQYDRSDLSLAAFAEDVGADAVATGSLTVAGDRLTLNVQLLGTESDRVVWGKGYEVPLAELQTLRRNLVADLATQLQVQAVEAPSAEQIADPEAYRLYLRGRYHFGRRSAADMGRAVELLDSAVVLDSTFADAYGVLASARLLLPQYAGGGLDLPLVTRLSERALELDAEQSDALAVRGQLAAGRYAWAAADEAFTRAIEADPQNSNVLHWYGLVLNAQGRFEEAKQTYARALDQDPVSLILNAAGAFPHFYGRDYESARRQVEAALELDPTFPPAKGILGRIYIQTGRYEEAVQILDVPELADAWVYVAAALGRAGRKSEALALLQTLEGSSREDPAGLAKAYVEVAELELALSFLEEAAAQNDPLSYNYLIDPAFDPLRDHPRYQAVIRNMNLDPSWRPPPGNLQSGSS